jgi:hypothetical protein
MYVERLCMAIHDLTDETALAFYECIRQPSAREARTPALERFGKAEGEQYLREKLRRRRIQFSPIDWC